MYHRSMLTVAKDVLRDFKGDVILQKDLLAEVSRLTGYSAESVRGSIVKASGGLMSPDVLNDVGFDRRRAPAAYVRRTSGKAEFFQSYASEQKQRSREYVTGILRKALRGRTNPRIITFGGHEGICVKHFYAVFPAAAITSVEKDLASYKSFLSKESRAGAFYGTFHNYALRLLPSSKVDLVNYDSHSYLCESMHRDLELLAGRVRPKVIALTMTANKNFRNHGAWVSEMRRKFGHYYDPALQCVLTTLRGYRYEGELEYTKENVEQAVPMRTLVFVRTKD